MAKTTSFIAEIRERLARGENASAIRQSLTKKGLSESEIGELFDGVQVSDLEDSPQMEWDEEVSMELEVPTSTHNQTQPETESHSEETPTPRSNEPILPNYIPKFLLGETNVQFDEAPQPRDVRDAREQFAQELLDKQEKHFKVKRTSRLYYNVNVILARVLSPINPWVVIPFLALVGIYLFVDFLNSPKVERFFQDELIVTDTPAKTAVPSRPGASSTSAPALTVPVITNETVRRHVVKRRAATAVQQQPRKKKKPIAPDIKRVRTKR